VLNEPELEYVIRKRVRNKVSSWKHEARERVRLPSRVRNYLCGLLALGLIASGRVRREKKKALGGDVVTGIYFHKPNARLFMRCIHWLVKNGYQFISASELLEILHDGKTPPKGAVWLSFDDGCKEIIEDVLPLIHSEKIPVTLFIPTGIVEGDGRFPWLHRDASSPMEFRDALAVDDIVRVASCPEVTIGSHTVTHAVMSGLEEQESRVELAESKRALEAWTGAEVACFAYPEGRFDGREAALLKQFGYLLAATTQNSFITRETQAYLVPRFSVADHISYPEAICNLVGVWRPAIDPLIHAMQRVRRITILRHEKARDPKPSRSS